MGVKLEWQIESDKRAKQNKQHHEDPQSQRRRWRNVFRIVVVMAIFIGLLALGVWLISQRLNQVDARQKSLLENTVAAEVASLRVGEKNTFISLQRSATNDWIDQQTVVFNRYQTKKAESDLNLTGRIIQTEISGQRGRVQVEEIENGVPYIQTWFYWNYDAVLDTNGEVVESGGWHHVPPDYTFWGEPQQIQSDRYVLRYQTLDKAFAQSFHEQMTAWFTDLCAFADCATLPYLTIDIVANPLASAQWAEAEAWQLLVPSPYIGRARADVPFDTRYQIDVATLLATRVGETLLSAQTNYDASFLQSSLVSWLVGKWVKLDTQAYLMTSIVNNYGVSTLGALLKTIQPTSDMSILAGVVGVADLSQAQLDWRDFLTWRLQVEANAIINRDQDTFLRLYDTRSDVPRQTAYDRFNANLPTEGQLVILTTVQTTSDGTVQLVATLADNSQIIFNLVNNVWLRAS